MDTETFRSLTFQQELYPFLLGKSVDDFLEAEVWQVFVVVVVAVVVVAAAIITILLLVLLRAGPILAITAIPAIPTTPGPSYIYILLSSCSYPSCYSYKCFSNYS